MWLRHPLEPLTVNGKVPIGDPVTVVIVIVDELPVVLLGVKLAVTPVGNPGALNVIGAEKPCNWLIDTVVEVLAPCVTDREPADNEKSPTTLRVTDVVRVTVPFTPEMIIGTLPAHAFPFVVMFIVSVVPHAGFGLKLTPTPFGCPEALKLTHPVNCPERLMARLYDVPLTGATLWELGLAAIEKSPMAAFCGIVSVALLLSSVWVTVMKPVREARSGFASTLKFTVNWN